MKVAIYRKPRGFHSPGSCTTKATLFFFLYMQPALHTHTCISLELQVYVPIPSLRSILPSLILDFFAQDRVWAACQRFLQCPPWARCSFSGLPWGIKLALMTVSRAIIGETIKPLQTLSGGACLRAAAGLWLINQVSQLRCQSDLCLSGVYWQFSACGCFSAPSPLWSSRSYGLWACCFFITQWNFFIFLCLCWFSPLFYPFKPTIKKYIVFSTSPLEGFLAVFSIYIILYLISLSPSYQRPPSDYNLWSLQNLKTPSLSVFLTMYLPPLPRIQDVLPNHWGQTVLPMPDSTYLYLLNIDKL